MFEGDPAPIGCTRCGLGDFIVSVHGNEAHIAHAGRYKTLCGQARDGHTGHATIAGDAIEYECCLQCVSVMQFTHPCLCGQE